MDDSDEWRDCTVMGSAYEQQVSRSGRWRHRAALLSPGTYRHDRLYGMTTMLVLEDRPWHPGPAPDVK